jgi:2-polyprenyl-6-methoxyphenol hydroxylase-like FAD-dependent oxidoreductase
LKPLDIAIIGAGPAGLASALYLHRGGHRVSIFERFEEAAPVGSGLMLQPTGLSVLHDLKLLSAIMARGHRIDRLKGSDSKSGRVVLDVRYDALSGGRFGLGVTRSALFDVLHDAVLAENIEIITGVAIPDIAREAGQMRLICEHERAAGKYDLVVDASGARSKLRRYALYPAEPKPLPFGALWATLDWPKHPFEPHALSQRYDKASIMLGVLPCGILQVGGAQKAAFFWSLKPRDFDAVKAQGLNAWKDSVLGYWPECAAFTDQISSFEDMTLAHYAHHTLKVPAGRQIAFVGDSAHSASPQLGQGANMALLDARALGHTVNISSSVETALEAYADARRWHMRLFQALSLAFTPFYQSDSAALAFIRDRLVSSIARVPPAPKVLAAMVSGTVLDPFKPIGLNEADWPALDITHA